MAYNRLIEVEIGPEGQTGQKYTNLRMSFSILKTENESTNKAEIKIYNMSQDNAAKLAKEGNIIIVRAGYEDEGDVKSLFFGQIERATIELQRTDRIISIEAYDGVKNYQNKNISISFAAGTPIQTVANEIISVLDIPLANPLSLPNLQYSQAFAFIGKAKDALTKVTNYAKKLWTIQNEQLVILSPGETITRTGLVLSSDTGLIQSPILLNDAGEEQDKEKVPKRYEVRSLLYPQLVPGADVKLESNIVNGFFRIESAEFRGDNFGNDWNSILEVVETA